MILENNCKQAPKRREFNGCAQLSVNVESTNRAGISGLQRKHAVNNARYLRDEWKTIGPKRGCNLDPALSMNESDLRYAC